MAKYHINNNDEVKVCNAKVKCRFGGKSGMENHFSSMNDAEVYVQKKIRGEYSAMNTYSRKAISSLDDLSSKGVRVQKVSSVIDHDFSQIANGSSVDVLEEKPTLDWLKNVRNNGFDF